MGRGILVLATLGLVLAGCGGIDAADSTTSTTSTSTTTTSTVATSTTTAPEACEEPLGGRAQPLEEGCMYVAAGFAVPLTLTVPGAGWWIATSAGDRWVELKYDADGDGGANASLVFAALDEDSDPIAVLDAIEAFEEIETRSEREAGTVAGTQAVVLDVQGDPRPAASPTGCSQPSGTGFFHQGTGYALQVLSRPEFAADALGIPACYLTRVWALSVEGWTIAAIGVTRNDDDFEPVMPVLQEFLDNNVTFGSADG